MTEYDIKAFSEKNTSRVLQLDILENKNTTYWSRQVTVTSIELAFTTKT